MSKDMPISVLAEVIEVTRNDHGSGCIDLQINGNTVNPFTGTRKVGLLPGHFTGRTMITVQKGDVFKVTFTRSNFAIRAVFVKNEHEAVADPLST